MTNSEKNSFFKDKITEATRETKEKIEALTKEADASNDITRNEDIYAEVDALKDKMYGISEAILNEILPDAFATVKETAKRFFHNPQLKVRASAFDREISAEKDYVNLEGDHAIWNNSWDAAGKPITWDMIHYDVQLIGGVAMHQGKIAEMQTGEGKTLVATLPMYLNALTGRGVHLVTVNDYLAKGIAHGWHLSSSFMGLPWTVSITTDQTLLPDEKRIMPILPTGPITSLDLII